MEGADRPAFEGSERYTIRRPIGGGAMGLVYEAWDRERQVPVALKTLRTSSPEALYRLKQEFRALADLSHPNLVRLYELVGGDDTWFIVMELVKGQRFLQWVRGQGGSDAYSASWPSRSDGVVDGRVDSGTPPAGEPSPPADLDRLRTALVQLVRGLAALHASGKMHRDPKPSNVLVTEAGRVVLVDFGLVYDADRAASELSRVDKVVGTAAYMAPEQARGETPGEGSDLYSVGVMLFQALTGRLPFEGPLVQVLYRKQHEEAPAPRTLLPELPLDLDRLCTDLLARDPEARPTALETLERLGDAFDPADDAITRPDLKRLEGRELQRQALEDAWATARGGHATLVHVHGRTGMGKTGLVRDFLAEVRKHEEVTVLRGRCWERERVPYKAFDHLVDGLRRRLKRMSATERRAVLPEDAAALARLFPVLRPLLPEEMEATPRVDPGDIRARAFVAFADLLGRLASRRPVLLFLDDVQWADVDSARLLAVLLRDLRVARVLFVVAWRSEDEDASPFLVHLRHDPTVAALRPREVDFEEFPDATATAVARALLGDDLADPSTTAVWLAHESGGSPFLMAELARSLRSAAEQGEPDLARSTVDDLFRQRVRGLPEDARRLMEVVGLAARPLPLRLLSHAAGLEGNGLDALDLLRARHLVRSTRGPLGDFIEPYHARIAAAATAPLDPAARRALHLRLAQVMATEGWHDPEALHEHFRDGGDPDRAGLLAAEAARAAADTLAFGRAADLYRAALELRDWPAAEHEAVQEELADALVYAGRGEEAARTYLEVAVRRPPPETLELRKKAAAQLVFAGDVGEGLALLEDVVEQCGVRRPPTSPFWTWLRTWFRRFGARRRPLDFEPTPAHQLDSALREQIDTCWFLSLGLGLVDPVQCAWYHARDLRLALDAGEPYRAARALALELGQAVAWGQSTSAHQARLMRRARQLATLSGKAHATALVDLNEGIAAYQEGRWDAARRALNRAHRVLVEQCTGVTFEVAAARLYTVKALTWRGEVAAASAQRDRLLLEAEEVGNRFLADGLRSDICVWLDLARGRPEEARAALDEMLARWSRPAWDERRLLAWSGELERLLWEGRAADAWSLFLAHDDDVRHSQLARLGVNRRRLAGLRGRVALALATEQGDRRLVREAWRAAHALDRGESGPPLARLLEAGAHAVLGRREAAADAVRLAVRGFEDSGMAMHRAVALSALAQLVPGEEAARAGQDASRWFEREGIDARNRLERLLAPGLETLG